MSTEDFFAKLDRELADVKLDQQKAKATAEENDIFLRQTVARLAPVVASYADQVRARGISVDQQTAESVISISLKYKDGGHFGTRLGRTMPDTSNRLEIVGSFTSDDGKTYSSTSGTTYDQNSWKDEYFTREIERCIKDFAAFAPRHGGI